ncbi:putative PEP-CTERM system TPR-repeat lipoprotein [Roseomonas rosea]|uniref:Putative PEP-CTERM system TPR-repeat lipoprotein n=1 Tax=Muricoccus roseus TaxID=198092 RepID=A0A1M6N970_9PROT|nr:XrtA/PEP-CTERM system TPR-repeat protein PrsT [Roseomonas rosea]SHJ92239.1 putative PEP-CTERM system TPR-repeat lipoprotein [Roseomonas rosea]
MSPIRHLILPFACAVLAWPAPASASLEKARAAQSRGELRAAQIELRNAVRADPNSAALRAALAQASLDLGEADAAERDARLALEHGLDPAAGTALLMRAYLAGNRSDALLRDFPAPSPGTPPAQAGQVMAGRSMAQLSLGRPEEARQSAEEALRLAPDAPEPHLAAMGAALARRDFAAAEAEADAALRADPASAEALLRKAALQQRRGALPEALETIGRVIAATPGHVQARLRRAELLIAQGRGAEARGDLDVALRNAPGSAAGIYLRAVIRASAEDWRGADEDLQRLGPAMASLPNALLLQARVKQALGQKEQAEDAARRYAARHPTDPRGAKLLAMMEMEAGRPDAAAGTLSRLASRGAADAAAYDLLARAHAAAERPREAAQALARAVELAPGNGELLARLAAAQFAAGDLGAVGRSTAEAQRIAPASRSVRQMVTLEALLRGDLAAAERELAQLDPAERDQESALMLQGTLHALRLQRDEAATAFRAALARNPESIHARLGLARLALAAGNPAESERLDGEVLARDPDNADAIGRLARAAMGGGPRAASARAALTAAQAARPGEEALAVALARVLIQAGDPAGAAALLDAAPLRATRRGPNPLLLLTEARAAAGQWAEAEAASRMALAEDPNSSTARRLLALLLARQGDPRPAEALLEEGLRSRPNDPELLGTLVGLTRSREGIDAALAQADRLAERPASRPASAMLRGDLLLAARRGEEAAKAFAAAYAREPSMALALRQSSAWRMAGKPAEAEAALKAWLTQDAESAPVLSALAQLEMLGGRDAEAMQHLARALKHAPADPVLLNNLAWLTQKREGAPALAEASGYAELAYYLAPSAEIADTLGWIRLRSGRAAEAVPLLRQAVAASAARGAADPGMSYRLALALRQTGARDEALRTLEPALARGGTFADRASAERLLTELRAGG